jgi:phosphatidylglycerol lysyltransferase
MLARSGSSQHPEALRTMVGVTPEVRAALLRQHGSFPQAYSVAFQPGLEHFGDERGFLAFKKIGGTAVVLCEPVVSDERRRNLIASFVEAYGDVCFCQVTRPIAEILSSMGFLVNEMGFETQLDLASFTAAGRKHGNWRKAANRVVAQGVRIEERSMNRVGAEAIDGLSNHWRKTRPIKGREICFLTRPIVHDDEPDVRKFFAFDAQGVLIGFNFFDPIYRDGQVFAYAEQIKRRSPRAEPLLNFAIQRHAIEIFRSEGRQAVYLGLAPLAGIHDKEFKHDWTVRRAFRFVYENGIFNRFVYPLKGLATHKLQNYRGGRTEQAYLAMNGTPTLPRLIKVLRACRIIPF